MMTLSEPPSAVESAAARMPRSALHRAILASAVMLGVAADALVRDGPIGLGFPVWVTLLVLTAASLVRRSGRRMPAETRGWLGVAVLFAGGLAWRDSDTLHALDFGVAGGAIAVAGIALSDPRVALFAERIRDAVWAGAAMVRSVALGVLPFAAPTHTVGASGERRGEHARPFIRAGLIALALLVVFGSLLRGADPIFASFVALPDLDVGLVVSHLVVAGFFAWIVAGWMRAALTLDVGAHRAPDALPFTLGTLDVTAALGTLNLLFALFVASQLGWLFGGERFLREQTGLTAAQYARQGFFQMSLVVALVVPVLLGTRAALRPQPALARRHTALALPIIVLLGAIIISAALRMRLYVHYFGLTTDRLYTFAFMAWLASVLVWLAATVLRDRGRTFLAGAVISGLAVIAVMNLLGPDRMVARVNIARAGPAPAGASPELDLVHLASLSAEAVPFAVSAVLAPGRITSSPAPGADEVRARCAAARRLLGRWGPSSRTARRNAEIAGWRRWNAGERRALAVVARHAAELRALLHDSCVAGPRHVRS